MLHRNEAPSRIEPCLLDEAGTEILDLIASLSGAAQALAGACTLARPPASPVRCG